MNDKRKNEWVEEVEVASQDLVARVKELIQEGNVRRLIIRKRDGDVIMEVPLTATVIAGGAMLVFAPLFAALGAAAAFLAEVKVEVVREGVNPADEEAQTKNEPKNKIDIE